MPDPKPTVPTHVPTWHRLAERVRDPSLPEVPRYTYSDLVRAFQLGGSGLWLVPSLTDAEIKAQLRAVGVDC